jgi:hypothetical protein
VAQRLAFPRSVSKQTQQQAKETQTDEQIESEDDGEAVETEYLRKYGIDRESFFKQDCRKARTKPSE